MINTTIKRGELFLIGGNGSGKSTLAMLLTGLYQPQKRRNLAGWRTCQRRTTGRLSQTVFGSVTDVWLFDQLLGRRVNPLTRNWLKWLAQLKMARKLELQQRAYC